ncbi:MAG: hypothetical protein GC152_09395 [Alphaproteobacteria bacterium]|nr:hypothetical protein [Alphaproteobacteria bacterium]
MKNRRRPGSESSLRPKFFAVAVIGVLGSCVGNPSPETSESKSTAAASPDPVDDNVSAQPLKPLPAAAVTSIPPPPLLPAEPLPEPEPVVRSSIEELPAPERSVTELEGSSPPLDSWGVPAASIDNLVSNASVDVALPPQPVSQFIDTVFGQLLEVPYITGPGVSERTDVIALRAPARTSKRKLFAMAEVALAEYGISLSVDKGVVAIESQATATAPPPRVIRYSDGSAAENGDAQPVLQYMELRSVEVSVLVELLKEVFPNQPQVRFIPRPEINTLLISGPARDVATAAGIIEQIDQPRFAGSQVARVEPSYWQADKLADALMQALNTEGYQAARGGSTIQRAVTVMTVPMNNQLIIFSNKPDAYERALFWVRQLDQPSAQSDEEAISIYEVRNTNAEELGRLLSATMSGAASGPAPPAQGAAPAAPGGAQSFGGGITVDPVGNRILFKGTPASSARIKRLLELLDTPPKQVLIELTIAEVTLTDETRFGVEWSFRRSLNGGTLEGSTLGGLGLTDNGLLIGFEKANVEAALSAFSSNNNVNILSTPRLVTRSGGSATFQVGTDVPIITSQTAASTQSITGTDILQTVQYRQTGVILNVRPVVYGNNRIELEITQEVSSQQSNPNAAIGSPLILNRSVQTQLSLEEGKTAIIGGLIQDGYTRGNTGIPGLKDMPAIGSLFRTDSVNASKTELLILVTPYIAENPDEMQAEADRYLTRINELFASRGPSAFTLNPWSGDRTLSAGEASTVSPAPGLFDDPALNTPHLQMRLEETETAPLPGLADTTRSNAGIQVSQADLYPVR